MAKQARSTSDLISHLPGDVTDNILMRLTLREAVKTSVLSKKWRYKWISVPHLVFDSSELENKNSLVSLTRTENLLIIYQVLLQHQGPISKFKLAIPRLEGCAEINILISFLTRKNPENSLKEFTLKNYEENPYKIPSCLFYCLQMRRLSLLRCVFHPPPDLAVFTQLTVIKFNDVDLPVKFADNFVANCPLLEILTLRCCTNTDSISFFAPNLKRLSYYGGVRSVSFKHTPALKSVWINNDGSEFPEAWEGNTSLQTFSYLRSVEHLYIGYGIMPILAMGIVPNRLASDLTSLVHLEIRNKGDAGNLSCVLCLIKSAPNFQKLTLFLSAEKTIDDSLAAEVLLEAKDSMRSLEQLKAVEVYNFEGGRSEMEFIKLLLAKSPVLETMLLRDCGDLDRSAHEKCIALQQQTNELPRASPNAKVSLLIRGKMATGQG